MQYTFFDQPQPYLTHDEIVAQMEALRDDPLAQFGGNMCIYRGNPHAALMIVGEGPGANEDRLRKPFVGKSGQLLDRIFESVGFNMATDVYITNTVFRRPPENRDPTTEELDYYKPYLMDLLRVVDPKIIVTTGRFSMRVILNERNGISKVRGQWYQVGNRWAMPIFHPAYLLRNPSRAPGSPKALMWKDVQEIRRKYEELVGR